MSHKKNKKGAPTKQERINKKISEAAKKKQEVSVGKLKEAFAIGSNIREACYYAEIHPSTYYDWIEKNPKLSDEFETIKQKLPLKAKHNIAKGIENGNIALSERYLAKQQPEEYGERLRVDFKNDDKKNDKEAVEVFHRTLKANIQERSIKKAKEDGELIE